MRVQLPAAFPRDVPLPEAEWRPRHRLVVAVLLAHLPFLVAFAVLAGGSPLVVALELVGIATLAGLALLAGSRVRRSVCATVGLLSCSAVLLQLTDGSIEAHFHFFVAVILVALYQDWRALLAAFGCVVVEPTLLGALSPQSVDHMSGGPLGLLAVALVHGGYVLAGSACLMVFWSYAERSRSREEAYRQQLLDTEMGALARMREAGQMREDLIASVSHEFRTPLTAIRGAAATLRQRGDQIRPEAREMLLAGICEHGERLTRLLEDMLAAASAAVTDPTAVSDVTAVVNAAGQRPGLSVETEPGVAAYIDGQSLTQLVQALGDHGLDHGRGDRAELAAALDGRSARLTLRYRLEGDRAEDAARVLEPFGSRESAATGRPTSLGAYVARRIAEVHGGEASAEVEGDLVRIDLRLRALRTRVDAGEGQRAARTAQQIELDESVRTA